MSGRALRRDGGSTGASSCPRISSCRNQIARHDRQAAEREKADPRIRLFSSYASGKALPVKDSPFPPAYGKPRLGLFRRRAPLAAQSLPAFVHQHQRQHQQQHGDDQLQGRHGAARPGQQGAALGHDAQHQGRERHQQHEEHGQQKHAVAAGKVLEPAGHGQQGQCGQQLVGRAEQGPDLGIAAKAQAHAQAHGHQRGHIFVDQHGPPAAHVLHALARGQPQFLEHVASQTGGRIQRGEAEGGHGQDDEAVGDAAGALAAQAHAGQHLRQAVGQHLGGRLAGEGMAVLGEDVAHGDERGDAQRALDEHGTKAH